MDNLDEFLEKKVLEAAALKERVKTYETIIVLMLSKPKAKPSAEKPLVLSTKGLSPDTTFGIRQIDDETVHVWLGPDESGE